jgi:hypothetical protein
MWHKYPNPHCTHVQTIDVLDRTVDPETGIIRTERVLGCKQKTPAWIVKVCSLSSSLYIKINHIFRFDPFDQLFGGSEDAFVREISFIDSATQSATITSVNLSLSQFATCYERIRYSPAASGEKTAFLQTAEIQARMALWRSAADRLEHWLVQRFEQNAQLGKVGFTDVLQSMWNDAKERHPARM